MFTGNPFDTDTTVRNPARVRIKVVEINGDRVCLAQEYTDEHGRSITLLDKSCILKSGDCMELVDIDVSLTFKEPK